MIRTLIVDDEKIARKGIISLMPWGKYDISIVGEADNVKNALKLLQSTPVDMIVTDLVMPGLSGLDLIKIVKKNYPEMWFVVLTCHQDFNYIQEALRLGAIDYIVKTQLNKERSRWRGGLLN